jgi:hypothetical protein
MEKNGVDYIAFDRRMKSPDEYYNTLTEKQISSITAISMIIELSYHPLRNMFPIQVQGSCLIGST